MFLMVLFTIGCTNSDKTAKDIDTTSDSWAYADSLDAVEIAPDSHEILLENDEVRILKVEIPPGLKEPMHTHEWKSVMIVEQPSRIRYYNDKDVVVFESDQENFSYEKRNPSWMDPEGLHAVENIDTILYSAIRIEIKK